MFSTWQSRSEQLIVSPLIPGGHKNPLGFNSSVQEINVLKLKVSSGFFMNYLTRLYRSSSLLYDPSRKRYIYDQKVDPSIDENEVLGYMWNCKRGGAGDHLPYKFICSGSGWFYANTTIFPG